MYREFMDKLQVFLKAETYFQLFPAFRGAMPF